MKLFRILLLTILLSSLFFSCKEEEPIEEISQVSMFNLHVETTDRIHYKFDWTTTNISDFLAYKIIGSKDSIPKSYSEVLSSQISFSADLANQSINSLDTILISTGENMFFRIFAVLDNGNLSSNLVQVEFESFHTLPNFPSLIMPDPDNNSVIIFDKTNNNKKLLRYDYSTKQVVVEKELTDDAERGFIEKWNGNSDLYLTGYNIGITILDAVTLEEIGKINNNGSSTSSIDTNDDGIIAASIEYSNFPVRFYSREDFSELDKTHFGNNSDHRGITFISPTENKGIEFSSDGLDYFELDANGQVIEHQSHDMDLLNLNYEQLLTSPQGNYFISTNRGLIFDKEMNYLDDLFMHPYIYHKDFYFTQDENILYTISSLNIVKYSFPNLEVMDAIPLPFLPRKMFFDDNICYVVGYDQITNQTTIQGFEF